VLQDEERKGRLELEKPIDCFFGADVYEVKAVFTSFGSSGITTREAPVTMGAGGQQLLFTLPPLPNDQITEVRFIQKRKPKPAEKSLEGMLVSEWRTRNLYASDVTAVRQQENLGNQSTLITRRSSLAGQLLLDKATEEIEIYRYHFKTSKYNTLAAKLAASATGVNATRTSSFGAMEGYQVTFAGAEGFDVFDVNGSSARNWNNEVFAIRPLVHLSEDDRWYQHFAAGQLYRDYWLALLSGYHGLNLSNLREVGGHYGGAPPTGPLRITPGSAEPALSNAEINATKSPYILQNQTINATSVIKAAGK
jgi:hypothetical protein